MHAFSIFIYLILNLSFQTAQAHVHLFEKCIKSLKLRLDGASSGNGQRADTSVESWRPEIENMLDCANKVSFSLSHCLTVFIQQEEVIGCFVFLFQ